MAQLKAEGKVKAVEVSTDDLAYIQHFNRDGGLEVVQLEYSVLNRRAEPATLPYLAENGIGVVVRGPLQKGLLAGKFTPDTTFPPGDVRAGWPAEEWYQRDFGAGRETPRTRGRGADDGPTRSSFRAQPPLHLHGHTRRETEEQVTANAAASARPLLSDDETAAHRRSSTRPSLNLTHNAPTPLDC